MKDHIIVRYGELTLKKDNRKMFIRKVNSHIERSLKEFDKLEFDSKSLRYYIHLNGTDASPIIEILKKIPGIYSFSVVDKTTNNLDDIKELAKSVLLEDFKDTSKTFKVETRRAEKKFPMESLEVTKEVSRYLFQQIEGLKANVKNPDLVLNIDIRPEATYIYSNVIRGMGGLPAGILGKSMLMVSGGIDSIIAGYFMIKKGIEIEAVHFESPPYTSDMALQKVIDLLETIAIYQGTNKVKLRVVPFTKIQQAIYDYTQSDYCITIMRRMMYRISERLAKNYKCLSIANGESIGQVASQTAQSILTINEVTKFPVIRPLSVFDKQDIMDVARKIGTYDISIRPYEDCCTVFVPKHPQTKPKLGLTRREEEKFDFQTLIEDAINETRTIVIDPKNHYSVIDTDDLF